MAVQAGINSTTANDAVDPSRHVQFIIAGPRAAPIYESIAHQIDCSTLGSNIASVPSWDASPATENTPEGDEVAAANYTTSAKTATGVMVSTRSLITDQWQQDSGVLASSAVDEHAANVRNAIDKGILDLFDTATFVSDNTGVALTLELWLAALAAFKGQLPGGEIAFVGSSNQMRDFDAALISGTGGAQIMGAAMDIFSSGANAGYRGRYNGVHMFESANVPANDAANDVGGFVSITAGQPGAPPIRSGLVLAVWSGIESRGLYVPSRHGIDTTTSARVGFARAAERLVRGVISKK